MRTATVDGDTIRRECVMVGMSIQQGMSDRSRTSGSECCTTTNVGMAERIASIAGGGFMALYGLRRGSIDGFVLMGLGGALIYRGVSGHCHGYKALGISTARDPETATAVPAQYGSKFEKAFTINRPAGELYQFWRRLSNLPLIMKHLKSVTEMPDGRSHWVAEGPMGLEVTWDAEIHNEDPGRMIAWRSLPGSEVDTAGSVHFEERGFDRGTEVRVSLKYNPPGGKLGAGLAWLMGASAEQEIEADLRRFKQRMEAGEVATTEGQPTGRS
jgi:uncharacterized membrane protein